MLEIAHTYRHRPEILDVGGRKSHYTVGVAGNVTVTDLPRQTEIQQELHLGTNLALNRRTYERRSNVHKILFDDMTRSGLPSRAFDVVVAVEVLEHVEEDSLFVSEAHRVLKPEGTFLMTTPNGDFLKVPFGDHKRHYARRQLSALLASCFPQVEVEYAIRSGVFRNLGRRPWSARHPLRTAASMAGNVVSSIQSGQAGVKSQAEGTLHLIATVRKQGATGDLRRAPRRRARLPVRVAASGGAAAVVELSCPAACPKGETLDVSLDGLSMFVHEERDLKGHFDDPAHTLSVELELPQGSVRLSAAPVRYEPAGVRGPGRGYLVGTKIVEMSRPHRSRYVDFLRTLNVTLCCIV
ncbi:MAG: methyltransferase domain-containing protein, partial [Pyrinomonadaceae bacterium]